MYTYIYIYIYLYIYIYKYVYRYINNTWVVNIRLLVVNVGFPPYDDDDDDVNSKLQQGKGFHNLVYMSYVKHINSSNKA
jgi:hypothetical protein